MKKIALLILSIFCFTVSYAQDIIIKNDKVEIKAKIEELTETTIKYKKFEMLDGPSYNINKRDVFMIIYKNGTKEYVESIERTPQKSENIISQNDISIIKPNNSPQPKIDEITGSKITHSKFIQNGKTYSYEGVTIKKAKQFDKILLENGSTEVKSLASGAVLYRNMALGLGITAGIGGFFGLYQGIRPGLLLGSAVLEAGGYFMTKLALKESTKALKLFNQEGIESKASLKPIIKKDQFGNHVGISIGF